MKKTRLTIIATIVFCTHAYALDTGAILAKPTAANPRFDDKELWPMLAGDEYFLKQKWPKGRTCIWNVEKSLEMQKKSGRRRWPKRDDPGNWIEAATGKPATRLPDMNTDLIMPDSETPYVAVLDDPSRKGPFCRHVTIGRNAAFDSPATRHHGIRLFGNLWIRPGGSMRTGQGAVVFSGGKHTFLRQEWPEDGVIRKLHDERGVAPYKVDGEIIKSPWMTNCIGTYMGHDKAEGASTEVVGFTSLGDEVGIQSGSFIVGCDSRFVNSGPASISIKKGGRIVLMDGAHCSHALNQFVNRDWNVTAGAMVTGGTPDRPLKRDAYMGLGYRNWQNLPIPRHENNKKPIPTTADGAKMYYSYGGYNAIVEGGLIGYPAPGSDARLVVGWQRISSGGAGHWGRSDEAFSKVFCSFVPKIAIWISPASMIENVRFDDLHLGGIVTESIETFRKWKNVSFGDACLSKDPEDLVRGYKEALAGQEKAHPKSALPPKKPYITMPGKNGG